MLKAQRPNPVRADGPKPICRSGKLPMPLPIAMSALFVLGRLAGVALLVAPLAAGADDSYLREIEDEAKRQAATLTTSQPQPAPMFAVPAPDAAAERLAPGLDRAGFERALREGLPETYASFQRITPAGQKRIYESYQKDNRLASIGEQIARLLGGKP